LICRKAGHPPGALIWVPVLQLFPLLRAAGMSGWWFLAFCVPLLNIVAQVLWCLNIAKARGKSVWVGVLLCLPITYLFAFLYLAFSNGGPAEEEDEREPRIMTLEAA
jgi:apolipoprotein N-acyltransferase